MRKQAQLHRALLLAPPLLVLLGGLKQVATSPLHLSGETETLIPFPHWALTLNILLMAAPFVLFGAWGVLAVARHTSHSFHIDVRQLLVVAPVLALTALILFLGQYNGRAGGGNDPLGLVAGALFFVFVVGGSAAGFILLYVHAVVDEGSGKYDKHPGEPDAMGALITEMKRR